MNTWRPQLVRTLTALIVAGCMTPSALTQRGVGQDRDKGRTQGENVRPAGPSAKGEKKQDHGLRGMVGLPLKWMERLREMSPEEQERFMANNERFQKLPPERQAQIRKRLQQWNSLTPAQRDEVFKRVEVWRQMSPEQKRHVREELLPKWQQLAPDRRQAILRRLTALRGMNESERAAKLNDPAFLQGLNPNEQAMFRELSKLRVGTPPEPPQENP